jgi:hypothetical protein
VNAILPSKQNTNTQLIGSETRQEISQHFHFRLCITAQQQAPTYSKTHRGALLRESNSYHSFARTDELLELNIILSLITSDKTKLMKSYFTLLLWRESNKGAFGRTVTYI